MALKFGSTSHSRWLVRFDSLAAVSEEDRQKGLSRDQIQEIKIFVVQYIQDIAKTSQNLVRQRVAATACTYFRRFYLRNNLCDFDPRLVGPACLFLACKTEECQVQARILYHFMRKLNATARYHAIPVPDIPQLLDLEMAILELLDFNLVVHSPYQELTAYLKDAHAAELAECAWAVLNDSYRTDICVMYSPQLIAVACMHVASVLVRQDLQPWLLTLPCDLDQVLEVSMAVLEAYRKHPPIVTADTCNRYLEFLR